MEAVAQKTFIQNVGSKLIWYIVSASLIHFMVTSMQFPIAFVKACHAFAFICFVFFILLDLPPMGEQTGLRGGINLFLTFAIFSAIYTATGHLHPQFNPAVEIIKINKPPLKLEDVAGPELIAAGKDVYKANKCYNCHKADGEGSSDRGPNFDAWQIGLYDKEYLMENIVDPKKVQSKGFEDEKSKKEMPDYYDDDLSDAMRTALLAFLSSLKNDQQMPVRGRGPDNQIPWDEDPEMIALGKKAFEGEINEDLNCSVCHGLDGTPLLEGSADFRDPNTMSTNHKKTLGEMTNAEWFYSVNKGVEDTPMAAWGEEFPPKTLWLAIAYAKQFQKQKK